jgi:hypothetical protein
MCSLWLGQWQLGPSACGAGEQRLRRGLISVPFPACRWVESPRFPPFSSLRSTVQRSGGRVTFDFCGHNLLYVFYRVSSEFPLLCLGSSVVGTGWWWAWGCRWWSRASCCQVGQTGLAVPLPAPIKSFHHARDSLLMGQQLAGLACQQGGCYYGRSKTSAHPWFTPG